MKRTSISIALLFFSMTMSSNGYSQDKYPALADRYLGQEPPGLMPKVFAPGIVSTEKHVESLYAFTPDMKEFYFSRIGGEYSETTMLVTRYNNDKWSDVSILSTDVEKYEERFTPGLLQTKKAPLKDIPFNGFSASSNGTYYFYFLEGDGSGHISYSRQINGEYEAPQKMNAGINSGKWIAHPFIAPDESYLMWDVETEGVDTPDIYISFRQKDDSWGAAINMGDKINTAAYEQRPRVTPDGKYLFFWRGDKKVREDGSTYWVGSPYWVDAKVINNLRPTQ